MSVQACDQKIQSSWPDIQNKVAGMYRISFHTLRNIISESNKLADNKTFTMLRKNHNHKKKKVNLNNFQKNSLHNIVYNFRTVQKILQN